MERRKAARYDLRVPVLFNSDDPKAKKVEGFTRDISTFGAYVLCEDSRCPFPGDAVEIELMLPPITNMEAQGMKLNFKGHVLRTGDLEKSGFAVQAQHGMELNIDSKNSLKSDEMP